MKLLWKEFRKYAVPSIIGMMVSALYAVVDGIFVGRGVGVGALASVNVAVPLVTLMIAITMMLTMGGSAVMSIKFGENKQKEGNDIFMQSLFSIIFIIAVLSITSVIFPYKIARFLGASPELIDGTAVYIRYYMMFGFGFAGSLALSAFIRNDGNPNLAMFSLTAGGVTNIVLDYIFIFKLNYGIAGAAVASGLGQLVSIAFLLTHFIRKKGSLRLYVPKFEKENIKRIFKAGVPEFIVQISPAISIFSFNIVIINRIGEIGVAAFSIISYISTVLIALFIGIAQGIQPLLSYNKGRGNYEKVDKIFKMGLKTNFISSALIYGALFFFGDKIIAIFNGDKTLINLTYNAIIIYAFSFVIASLNIINITYYQSIEKSKIANIISTSRGIIFPIFYLIVLPLMLGDIGIWVSIIIAELCTFFLVLYLIYVKKSMSTA